MTRLPGKPLKVEAPELRLDPEALLRAPVDWRAIFGRGGRVDVEVGIGKGRFLLTAASSWPEVDFLGIDWANQFLRIAESRADRLGLSNVRFARLDARELIQCCVPDRSVGAYYVLYPDPWPKKRHQKRRFLQAATADHLVRTLVPGGGLHVATDHRDYWQVIEPLFDSHPAFERIERFGGDDFPVPVDEPLTNFEIKYRDQGRERFRASWRRRPGAVVDLAPVEG